MQFIKIKEQVYRNRLMNVAIYHLLIFVTKLTIQIIKLFKKRHNIVIK